MRPHSLAVKHGKPNPKPKDFPFNIGNCECTCGIKYTIFVNHAHYDLGGTFCKYVEELLRKDHQQNKDHHDVIELPMEAEFWKS